MMIIRQCFPICMRQQLSLHHPPTSPRSMMLLSQFCLGAPLLLKSTHPPRMIHVTNVPACLRTSPKQLNFLLLKSSICITFSNPLLTTIHRTSEFVTSAVAMLRYLLLLFFSKRIFFKTSPLRYLCEIDDCPPPPLSLLFHSTKRMYNVFLPTLSWLSSSSFPDLPFLVFIVFSKPLCRVMWPKYLSLLR